MRFLRYLILFSLAFSAFAHTSSAQVQEELTIDAHAVSTAFPHFWEQMFGSGRAILSLREEYRDDLRAVKK